MNEKTLFYIDPTLETFKEVVAIVDQLGLPIVPDAARAHVRIVSRCVPEALCYVEGDAFSVADGYATFDRRAMRTLLQYRREVKNFRLDRWTFPVSVDGSAKGETIHRFATTLFSFVLQCKRPISFLWFFPHAAQGVANYRVDVDDNIGESVGRVLDQVGSHAPWSSFFFATSAFTQHPELVLRCRDMGAEVGSHGHYHHTYERDGKSNARNVRESLHFFRKLGMTIRSYVTPSAKSYAGIGKLMAEEQFEYTSNFGMIHDALPLMFQDGAYSYLEVPIHPICPGNLLHQPLSMEEADVAWLAYSRQTARALATSFLPLFLYGHNNDNYKLTYLPTFLDEVVRDFPNHVRLTLADYARFWKQRLERCRHFADDASADNVATISPDVPDQVVVTDGAATKTYAFSLSAFLQPPNVYQPFVSGASWYTRMLTRNEFERIVPIRLVDPRSVQGLKKIAYKVVSPVCKAMLQPLRRLLKK